MTFVFALIVLLLVATRGEAKKEDKDDKKPETGKHDLADIYKKLEEQIAVNEEFRKEVADLRQADSLRQKEIANLKMDDIKLRQADAQLRTADATMRKADAQLREADSKILDAKRKTTVERRESRRQERKRQDDVEAATKALIRAEIERYHSAHNDSEELKTLILSEIKKYQANGDRRLIGITGGKANWDSATNTLFPVKDYFSTNRNKYGCGGMSSSSSAYDKPFPQTAWYEFPSAHSPTRFAFRSYDGTTSPLTWRFVGSRDENCNQDSSWIELCGDVSGSQKSKRDQEVGCDVPKYLRAPYRCLGLRTYSNYPAVGDSRVCIYGMKFWEIPWNN